MGRTILLVDDSAISRVILRTLIENNFADDCVIEAASAEEALEICHQQIADLVFLDEDMPGDDGLEAAPKLRALCPNARIALLTSNFQERVEREAYALGLDFYTKPVTLDKVRDFIESPANSRR